MFLHSQPTRPLKEASAPELKDSSDEDITQWQNDVEEGKKERKKVQLHMSKYVFV